MASSILSFSWEQALQTPGEATAPAESNGAAMASTATSADSAGMQAEEQQKEPEPTSPEHAEQEENEELEEAWFDWDLWLKDRFKFKMSLDTLGLGYLWNLLDTCSVKGSS